MNNRIDEIVEQLRLSPHPQGGFLGQSYLSESTVEPDDGRGKRPTLSTMYVLVLDKHPNTMHALKADETWHYCEGSPLELFWIADGETKLQSALLGPTSADSSPMVTIPGNCWRGARSSGEFSLISCIVGPAFDPNDFTPIVVKPELIAMLSEQHPHLKELL